MEKLKDLELEYKYYVDELKAKIRKIPTIESGGIF